MKKCNHCGEDICNNDLKSSEYYCARCLSKVNDHNVYLSFEEFESLLKQEIDYHYEKSYREKTSRLSLKVALKTRKVNVFLDQEKSKELVFSYLSEYDDDRKNDVEKMLRVIANSMYLERTTSRKIINYANAQVKKFEIIPPGNKR